MANCLQYHIKTLTLHINLRYYCGQVIRFTADLLYVLFHIGCAAGLKQPADEMENPAFDGILQPVGSHQLPHVAERHPLQRSRAHDEGLPQLQQRRHLQRMWLFLAYEDLPSFQAEDRVVA